MRLITPKSSPRLQNSATQNNTLTLRLYRVKNATPLAQLASTTNPAKLANQAIPNSQTPSHNNYATKTKTKFSPSKSTNPTTTRHPTSNSQPPKLPAPAGKTTPSTGLCRHASPAWITVRCAGVSIAVSCVGRGMCLMRCIIVLEWGRGDWRGEGEGLWLGEWWRKWMKGSFSGRKSFR